MIDPINKKIEKISQKLDRLRALDLSYSLFGAKKHKYILNPCVSIDVLESFERDYQIELPEEYVAFITRIGGGGAGPYYGVEPFSNVLFADLDDPSDDNRLYPNLPFIHTESWQEIFEPTCHEYDDVEFERQYAEFYKNKMDGVLSICNYGCGVSLKLVVHGAEYGHIWVDDRMNNQGVHPLCDIDNSDSDRLTFLNWYELWLDASIEKLSKETN